MSSTACPACGLVNTGNQSTCLACGGALAAAAPSMIAPAQSQPLPHPTVRGQPQPVVQPQPQPLPPSHSLPQPVPVPTAAPPVIQPQPVATTRAPQPFQPSHIVPAEGLATWPRPDGRVPAGPSLPPYLEVQVVATTANGWAQVRCSNEWTAWVAADQLIPRQF